MRILHTSDWHLGARLGSQDRLADQFQRLEELCHYLDEHEVKLLLVAGDIFDEHRSEALARIVERLALLLAPRVGAGLTCVFIAGNHDREHVFPLLRGLQELVGPPGVRQVVFTERPGLMLLEVPGGGSLNLMLLPYPTPTRYDLPIQRWPSPDTKRKALAEAMRARIRELAEEARESGRGRPTVLCGHFLVRGVRDGMYQLSEQDDVPVEPADLPAYAYIALGHIHKPQMVGAPYIRYSGSLERMDRAEADQRKQALLVEVGPSGLHEVRELPLSATPFAHLEASSEVELEEAAASLRERDRTLVSLTLSLRREQSVGALQARARHLFPRLYSPPEVRWLDAPAASRPAWEVDRRDVSGTVRRYLQQVLAEDPDRDALMALAEELLAQVEGGSP